MSGRRSPAMSCMHRTGLALYGQEDDAVRWVAIRHAADHVHIVAMLARQDGQRPRFWNDYFRVGEACRAAEDRYGLRRTAPRDRTAARRPTRAESEKARRRGYREAPRVTLKRVVSTAAAGASSEQEFFTRLQNAGVLVRKPFSTRNPGEVTGYAVALPHDTTQAGGPVWYGGRKLAPDLTLPKLRHRWHPSQTTPGPAFTAAERNEIWDHVGHSARRAAEQIRYLAATDPAAAADAAWAAADTLHVAASALGSRVIRQAAAAYDRAARVPYGRIPRPTPAGNGLRTAARLLSAAGFASNDPIAPQIRLLIRLAALAEAIADVRVAQRKAAQATVARRAAERLRAARGLYATPQPITHIARARTAADVAGLGFPMPPGPYQQEPAATRSMPTQGSPTPSRSCVGPGR